MGKRSRPRREGADEARAFARNMRISPRKLDLVARSIRGMQVGPALSELAFSRKRVAGAVREVLRSAVANAENNHQLDVDRLYVAEASVGRAAVLKRYRARARGRIARIRKPFSNLTIIVREEGGR